MHSTLQVKAFHVRCWGADGALPHACRLKASDGCGRKAFLLVAGDRFMFAADREQALPSDSGVYLVVSISLVWGLLASLTVLAGTHPHGSA